MCPSCVRAGVGLIGLCLASIVSRHFLFLVLSQGWCSASWPLSCIICLPWLPLFPMICFPSFPFSFPVSGLVSGFLAFVLHHLFPITSFVSHDLSSLPSSGLLSGLVSGFLAFVLHYLFPILSFVSHYFSPIISPPSLPFSGLPGLCLASFVSRRFVSRVLCRAGVRLAGLCLTSFVSHHFLSPARGWCPASWPLCCISCLPSFPLTPIIYLPSFSFSVLCQGWCPASRLLSCIICLPSLPLSHLSPIPLPLIMCLPSLPFSRPVSGLVSGLLAFVLHHVSFVSHRFLYTFHFRLLGLCLPPRVSFVSLSGACLCDCKRVCRGGLRVWDLCRRCAIRERVWNELECDL